MMNDVRRRWSRKTAILSLWFFAVLSLCVIQGQAAVSAPDSQVFYRTGLEGESWGILSITGVSQNTVLKKNSVRSSNRSVVQAEMAEIIQNKYSTVILSNGKVIYGKNCSVNISLVLKKAGNARITYRIGNKTYRTKITVRRYQNPCRKIVVTGVQKGRNLAAGWNRRNYASFPVRKAVQNSQLILAAKAGWKIETVKVINRTKKTSLSYECTGSPVSELTLHLGKLSEENEYEIYVLYRNGKDQGTLEQYLELNKGQG